MIHWSNVNLADRSLGASAVILRITGIAAITLLPLVLLVSAILVVFGPTGRAFPFTGGLAWFIGFAPAFRRLAKLRHFGDSDGARTAIVGIVATVPVALISAFPVTAVSHFCSIYLASYLGPAIWLEVGGL